MFNHYIAVDWSQKTMAIARMTKSSNRVQVREVPTDIKELKFYLGRLKGEKVLTIEESNTSQWLYTELRECVDELIVCDPYRNHLLKEGAKNDKIDAEKLCRLLKGGLLKGVFHTGDAFIYLRKLVSDCSILAGLPLVFGGGRGVLLGRFVMMSWRYRTGS